jgi:hypothetical protein
MFFMLRNTLEILIIDFQCYNLTSACLDALPAFFPFRWPGRPPCMDWLSTPLGFLILWLPVGFG